MSSETLSNAKIVTHSGEYEDVRLYLESYVLNKGFTVHLWDLKPNSEEFIQSDKRADDVRRVWELLTDLAVSYQQETREKTQDILRGIEAYEGPEKTAELARGVRTRMKKVIPKQKTSLQPF